jgi:hypothetical protein
MKSFATGGREVNEMKEWEATNLLKSARRKDSKKDEQDSQTLVSLLRYLSLPIEQAAIVPSHTIHYSALKVA